MHPVSFNKFIFDGKVKVYNNANAIRLYILGEEYYNIIDFHTPHNRIETTLNKKVSRLPGDLISSWIQLYNRDLIDIVVDWRGYVNGKYVSKIYYSTDLNLIYSKLNR